jgi:hypothetical protein
MINTQKFCDEKLEWALNNLHDKKIEMRISEVLSGASKLAIANFCNAVVGLPVVKKKDERLFHSIFIMTTNELLRR